MSKYNALWEYVQKTGKESLEQGQIQKCFAGREIEAGKIREVLKE